MMRKLFLAIWMVLLPFWVEAAIPHCYQDLQRNFFKPEYVAQALSLQQMVIGQSSWSGINTAIQQQAGRISNLVDQRAKKMSPNPFAIPYRPEDAGEVFKSVVIDIIRDALAQFNFTSQAMIMQIFEFLKQKNIDLWDQCFVTGVPLKPQSKK